MMRAALVQQASGDYIPMLESVMAWHSAYARRHGILYQPSFGSVVDGRSAKWGRFPLLIQTMKAGYADIVVWLDTDCVIADPKTSLLEATNEFLLIGAVVHPETYKDEPYHLNMGVMYLRTSPKTIDLLERVHAMGHIEGEHWDNQPTIYTVARELKIPICRIGNRWNSTVGVNECLNPVVVGFHGTETKHAEDIARIARDNLKAAQ